MSNKKQKPTKKQSGITWRNDTAKANTIDPTPGNFKLKTELGDERLNHSLGIFGMAGTILVNPSKKKGRWDLINGNSRWQKQMEKDPNGLMNISVPSRPLTPKEYKEMAAMVDFAVAGEVDVDRIQKELGKTEDFFKAWGMEINFDVLETMGKKNNKIETLQHPDAKNSKGSKGKVIAPEVNVQMVSMFFNDKEEAEFRKMEVVFMKRYKTDDTTEVCMKVYRELFKSLKLKYEKEK